MATDGHRQRQKGGHFRLGSQIRQGKVNSSPNASSSKNPDQINIISTIQVIFYTKKQDLIIRKCSDKSTDLRPPEVPLGAGR